METKFQATISKPKTKRIATNPGPIDANTGQTGNGIISTWWKNHVEFKYNVSVKILAIKTVDT